MVTLLRGQTQPAGRIYSSWFPFVPAGQPVARRLKSEVEAAEILSMALRRYYDDALVRYNLACYWCVMGRIEEAREMLETACKKDESLRGLAETDEDLVRLR